MLRYHYQYVTVLPQCDAIVSKKSESVMAGGANDAETLCSWRSKLTFLTLSDAVTILTTATQFFPSVTLNGKPISRVFIKLGSSLSKARYEALERRARSIIKFGAFEPAPLQIEQQIAPVLRALASAIGEALRPSDVAPISTRMHCFSSSRRAWKWMPSAQI